MPDGYKKTTVYFLCGLLLMAIIVACGADQSQNGQMVAVNLSLVVDTRQAQHQSTASKLLAFIERWLPSAVPAWAQSASEIATIQVQITGPDIPVPITEQRTLTNPTSGQEITFSLQAPVGQNRTISVAAFNVLGQKIFGGTLSGVTLMPGPPIPLVITLVRVFTVTVEKQGAGSGTVTSSPGGIDCGAICSAQFEEGASVTLNAAAAPGASFGGWSGACSGTGPCALSGGAMVTATFNTAVDTARLTVSKSGSGTVNSTPSGISCGSVCTANFERGSTVELTAVAIGGSTFVGWSGAGCAGTGACVVVMSEDQTVTATFTTPPSLAILTVTRIGTGTGTVSSAPAGIDNCAETCSASFPLGTTVTLTPTPTGGSTFIGWGNACSGTGACSVVMNANQSVTATFTAPVSTAMLTVTKIGGEAGTVTSNPAGIDCGNFCSAAFPTGSLVTLTATPAAGSAFVGWSGGGCAGTEPCVTAMGSDQAVVAIFDPAPDLLTLSVNRTGPGDGTVTSAPPGINCGGICQANFPRGTVVTLTAVPDEDSEFDEWNGNGCNGDGPCVLVMDDNRSMNARFDDD